MYVPSLLSRREQQLQAHTLRTSPPITSYYCDVYCTPTERHHAFRISDPGISDNEWYRLARYYCTPQQQHTTLLLVSLIIETRNNDKQNTMRCVLDEWPCTPTDHHHSFSNPVHRNPDIGVTDNG